jgi:DNA-binding transcriptional MerR regulator
MLYTFEGSLKKFSFKTKNYSIFDTNLSTRQVNHYEEKGLLLSRHQQYYTYKFSLREIIWLRLISRFRDLTLSLETIKEIKEELFKETKLSEYLLDPNFDDYLDVALDNTDLTPLEKSEIKSTEKIPTKNLLYPVNYFDVIISQLIDNKNRISLIIAVKKDSDSLG